MLLRVLSWSCFGTSFSSEFWTASFLGDAVFFYGFLCVFAGCAAGSTLRWAGYAGPQSPAAQPAKTRMHPQSPPIQIRGGNQVQLDQVRARQENASRTGGATAPFLFPRANLIVVCAGLALVCWPRTTEETVHVAAQRNARTPSAGCGIVGWGEWGFLKFARGRDWGPAKPAQRSVERRGQTSKNPTTTKKQPHLNQIQVGREFQRKVVGETGLEPVLEGF